MDSQREPDSSAFVASVLSGDLDTANKVLSHPTNAALLQKNTLELIEGFSAAAKSNTDGDYEAIFERLAAAGNSKLAVMGLVGALTEGPYRASAPPLATAMLRLTKEQRAKIWPDALNAATSCLQQSEDTLLSVNCGKFSEMVSRLCQDQQDLYGVGQCIINAVLSAATSPLSRLDLSQDTPDQVSARLLADGLARLNVDLVTLAQNQTSSRVGLATLARIHFSCDNVDLIPCVYNSLFVFGLLLPSATELLTLTSANSKSSALALLHDMIVRLEDGTGISIDFVGQSIFTDLLRKLSRLITYQVWFVLWTISGFWHHFCLCLGGGGSASICLCLGVFLAAQTGLRRPTTVLPLCQEIRVCL